MRSRTLKFKCKQIRSSTWRGSSTAEGMRSQNSWRSWIDDRWLSSGPRSHQHSKESRVVAISHWMSTAVSFGCVSAVLTSLRGCITLPKRSSRWRGWSRAPSTWSSSDGCNTVRKWFRWFRGGDQRRCSHMQIECTSQIPLRWWFNATSTWSSEQRQSSERETCPSYLG